MFTYNDMSMGICKASVHDRLVFCVGCECDNIIFFFKQTTAYEI